MSGPAQSAKPGAPRLTKARADFLLAELSQGLSGASSKEKAHTANETHKEPGCGGQAICRRQQVAASVRREVLPLYGFEDSQEGLGQMWAALKPFLDDKCLAEMAETVRSEFEVLEPDEEPAPSKAESPPETLAVEGTFYTKPAHWSQQRVWVLPRYLSDVHSWTVFLDITEGMTVGDLRGRLKPYFCGVSESRLRLQYFSGAILKDLPDTADASRAIAMFITHAVPSRHPEDCRPVSKEQILGIQKECLERFSTPEFQKELEGLIRKVHKNAPCYGINQKRPLIWIVPGRFELIKKVQEQVFPKYGFERGLKSMAAVSAAFDPWIHDVDVVEICEKVNTQLALPPQLYDLRRLTF